MFYYNNKKSEITNMHTHIHTKREKESKRKRIRNQLVKKKRHDPSTSQENIGNIYIQPCWTTGMRTVVEDSSKQYTEGHSSQEEQDSHNRLVCLTTLLLLVFIDKPN